MMLWNRKEVGWRCRKLALRVSISWMKQTLTSQRNQPELFKFKITPIRGKKPIFITKPNCALDRCTILCLYVAGFRGQVFKNFQKWSERSKEIKEQRRTKWASLLRFGLVMFFDFFITGFLNPLFHCFQGTMCGTYYYSQLIFCYNCLCCWKTSFMGLFPYNDAVYLWSYLLWSTSFGSLCDGIMANNSIFLLFRRTHSSEQTWVIIFKMFDFLIYYTYFLIIFM